MEVRIGRIPAGEAGTDATLKVMGQAVQAALRRPVIRQQALAIIQAMPFALSDSGRIGSALFDWVRRNIRYVPDPVDLETIQTPEATLELRAGDCDDHAVLLVALSAALGISGRFRVVGLSRSNFAHVYPELHINGAWVPADTTTLSRLGEPMGRFPATKTYDFRGEKMVVALGSRLGAPVDPMLVRNAVYQALLQKLSTGWHSGKINHSDLAAMRVKVKQVRASNPDVADLMDKALFDYQNHVKNRASAKPSGLSGLGSLGFFDTLVKAATTAYNAIKGGGGGSSGTLWDRMSPIQVGQLLREGTTPVDAAFVTKINAQWKADLERGYHYGDIVFAQGVSSTLWPNILAAYRAGKISTGVAPAASPTAGGSLISVNIPSGGLIQTQVSPEAARAGVTEMLSSPTVLIGLGLVAMLVLPKLLKR